MFFNFKLKCFSRLFSKSEKTPVKASFPQANLFYINCLSSKKCKIGNLYNPYLRRLRILLRVRLKPLT